MFDQWLIYLRSQIVTSNWGGSRYLPMAFTEQGVAMLSSILKSNHAVMVNNQIMRVFTRVREALMDNLSVRLEIEEIKQKLVSQDKSIELVFNYLDEMNINNTTSIPVIVKGFKPTPK
jgi:hypothetical protein